MLKRVYLSIVSFAAKKDLSAINSYANKKKASWKA